MCHIRRAGSGTVRDGFPPLVACLSGGDDQFTEAAADVTLAETSVSRRTTCFGGKR